MVGWLYFFSVWTCLYSGGVFAVQIQCSKQHISSSLAYSADCQPRDKVIRLEPPGNMTAEKMTPLYISVKRCGGACSTSSQSCVPTKQIKKEVPVIIGSCGVESGLCEKQCYSLTVTEDVDCHCNCLDTQKECGEGKMFVSDSCSCLCKDLESAKKCRDSGRLWHTDTCTCGCPIHTIVQCTTGLEFNNETCSCIDVIFRTEEDKQKLENRVERSDFLVGHVDFIIIPLFSSVFLLFIFSTIVLVRKVAYLRRQLERLEKQEPAVDLSYMRCSNPTPEDMKTINYSTMSKPSPEIYEHSSLLNNTGEIAGCGRQNKEEKYRSAESPPPRFFLSPKLQSDPYAKLLDCEGGINSDSLDSTGSRIESGFGSGNEGSRVDSTDSSDGFRTSEPREHFLNDRLSVLSSAILSNHSNSNPSIFSVVSRAPSHETPV